MPEAEVVVDEERSQFGPPEQWNHDKLLADDSTQPQGVEVAAVKLYWAKSTREPCLSGTTVGDRKTRGSHCPQVREVDARGSSARKKLRLATARDKERAARALAAFGADCRFGGSEMAVVAGDEAEHAAAG